MNEIFPVLMEVPLHSLVIFICMLGKRVQPLIHEVHLLLLQTTPFIFHHKTWPGGVTIEILSLMQNLLCVVEVETPNNFGGIEYLGFEKLTFVPIQVH